MWVIEVKNPGIESRLYLGERPIPKPLPHEVLIKTYAAGINRADIFQRNGLYPPPPGASDVPGLEISGIIEQIGSEVTSVEVGDKVCALLEGGGYAQYAVAPASQTLPIPNNLDFIQAASIPEALFTVYSNIFHHAQMKAGQSLLIHGGASGIGTFAIQIAKAFNIKIYTTAGTDEKCKLLENLGAIAINYKDTDFVEEIKLKTGGAGVDCIIDIVGGEYFNRNLKCLAINGKLICISFLQGSKVEANLAPLVFRNLSIFGTTLRGKSLEDKAIIAKDLKRNIWPLLENGQVKPVIDSVFNFSDAENAHKLMKSSKHIGKIILKCS